MLQLFEGISELAGRRGHGALLAGHLDRFRGGSGGGRRGGRGISSRLRLLRQLILPGGQRRRLPSQVPGLGSQISQVRLAVER